MYLSQSVSKGIMIGSLFILFLLVAVLWFRSKRHPKNFPPGPRFPLPLIGDAWVLGSDVTLARNKLADR